MYRLKFKIFIVTLIAILVSCSKSSDIDNSNEGGDQPKKCFSGTFVTNVASNVLNSRQNIIEAVDRCSRMGINNIFVVTWNKGRTLYPSQVMKKSFGVEISENYEGRDPLKEMIEEAHKKSIKVYAWFEYGFSCSYGQNGGIIIAKKPHWAAKDISGNLLNKGGFEWMNPIQPEVQEFMESLFLEVVSNYDVDGVMGDDRFPAMPVEGGYDNFTIELYKKEHGGVEPPRDWTNQAWIDWRSDKLTSFMGELYKEIKAVKKDVVIASAPTVYPWGKTNYLQDWPKWIKNGYVELVMPQIYRYDFGAYQSTLNQQINQLTGIERNKFYPIVLMKNGDYQIERGLLKKIINENRRLGINGEAFWFYEGLKEYEDLFINL